MVTRTCLGLNQQQEPCRQAPLKGSEFCFWHSPDHEAEAGEARRLGSFTEVLREIFSDPAELVRKDRKVAVHGPIDLLNAILSEGEKGLALQRYKGLAEMNPNQLWETTLDPEARTLLQVRVEDVAEADDLFTKLMGDVVEPRREFIQANALSICLMKNK